MTRQHGGNAEWKALPDSPTYREQYRGSPAALVATLRKETKRCVGPRNTLALEDEFEAARCLCEKYGHLRAANWLEAQAQKIRRKKQKEPSENGKRVYVAYVGTKQKPSAAFQITAKKIADGSDEHRDYMGNKTTEEYRAYYRERRRKQRAQAPRHPCARCPELVPLTATYCRRHAALVREERISQSGKPTNRGKAQA